MTKQACRKKGAKKGAKLTSCYSTKQPAIHGRCKIQRSDIGKDCLIDDQRQQTRQQHAHRRAAHARGVLAAVESKSKHAAGQPADSA